MKTGFLIGEMHGKTCFLIERCYKKLVFYWMKAWKTSFLSKKGIYIINWKKVLSNYFEVEFSWTANTGWLA